ncbi:glutamate--tRNA ligase 1 [Tepiditoga spiralis]|uniref:Glutamate--tRNA ligase n=1 Tax=Tepiditoga spiralis TaxID=2108365 RepID=A0A7G1G219_9BACT|nr:glutamate--tRNA ligase [Tepiditoga spiralis]BBE30360.1 glutamate--tRNA ligase 1 [Tepiditoga spiralis]
MIRTRFAPSPTGYLHVGGARTALFNYLFARKNGGKFILRIEDTDIERSTKESEEQLIKALKWLGLDWDEGPQVGGEVGPYRQSERTEIYKQKTKELIESGKAYEAYAYSEELDKIKEELLAAGKPPHYSYEEISKYDTPERRKEFEEKGLKPVVFFKMPRKDYSIKDLIKGDVTFKKGAIGDFVLMRSNGLPTYNYAVVIDDMLMQISHVIRGDDHLSNTLRQVAIYEAFEMPLPQFAHVSMILGTDGKRLSKRHGATSVEEFKYRGYLPESVVNYLALLGWSHPEGKEIVELSEMIEKFDLDRVNSSPAVFDEVKMKWMNANYIRKTNVEKLYELSIPFITESKLLTEEQCKDNKKWLLEAFELIKTSVEELQKVPEELSILIKDFEIDETNQEFLEYLNAENVKQSIKIALEKFINDEEWTEKTVLENLKIAMKEAKPAKKPFYMALRKSITNEFHGPDLVKSIHLIGRARVIERLERVVNL